MTLRTHLDGQVFADHRPGEPPTLLALHGWGRDRSDLLPALGDREVVALDLPGFGASPAPPEAWGAQRYAEAVAELLHTASIGPVLVVGHSFGGRVAVHLAADHPDTVAGVVLTGVPLWRRSSGGRPALSYRLVRAARRARLVPERTLEGMRRRHGSADYRAATGTMRDVLVRVVNEDYRPQLAALRCPVGFCWGADDTAAPVALAREAAEIVRDAAALDVVEGVGHDVHRAAPERLAAVIATVAKAIA